MNIHKWTSEEHKNILNFIQNNAFEQPNSVKYYKDLTRTLGFERDYFNIIKVRSKVILMLNSYKKAKNLIAAKREVFDVLRFCPYYRELHELFKNPAKLRRNKICERPSFQNENMRNDIVINISESSSDESMETLEVHGTTVHIPQKINSSKRRASFKSKNRYKPKIAQKEIGQEKIAQEEIAQKEIDEEETAQPEIGQQEIAQPEIAQEEIVQKEISEEQTALLEITQPVITHKKIAQKEIAQEKIAQEETALPEMTQPEIAQPTNTQPVDAKEEIAQEEIAQPEIPQKEIAQEKIAEPEIVQPKLEIDNYKDENIVNKAIKINQNGIDSLVQSTKPRNQLSDQDLKIMELRLQEKEMELKYFEQQSRERLMILKLESKKRISKRKLQLKLAKK